LSADVPGNASLGGRRRASAGAAALIGAGILLSRLLGLVRERVMSKYLGLAWQADVFAGAFRIPNFLQNIFGEGVLSASFIPVYSRLLADGDEEEANRLAGAIGALLLLAVALLVAIGIVAAPLLVGAVVGGFVGEKRALAIRLVRILFPGAGLLVLSAWCLGILNSHRRFFLSYTAPVLWNLAMIGTLLATGGRMPAERIVVALAWGSVGGSLLQFVVQLPAVLRLVRRLRLRIETRSTPVRGVLRSFGPVVVGRGVVQISAWIDATIASYLVTGAVAGLNKAQLLYLLPISLFGQAVSAAELPEMASVSGARAEVAARLQERLNAGMRRIAFFIVPSAAAFLALGDVLVGAVMQTGAFGPVQTRYVWGILAGSSVGLLASALGRLDASTYYALRDTRTPLYTAIMRILLTTGLGLLFAFPVPRLLGLDPKWGAAGLTASAGIAGWVEFLVLRGILNRRIGRTGLPVPFMLRLWAAALVAVGVAWAIKLSIGLAHPILAALLILGPFGLVYFALSTALGVPESREVTGRLLRRLGRTA
jgi:putative peptidoglycan lipid II flippase